jgi:hypothetical protein
MSRLSEIQSLLLSHASRQGDGSLYPLPETLCDARRTTRPIAALLRAGLIEERETSDTAAIARVDGDLSYGLYLTADGAAAIGLEPEDAESRSDGKVEPNPPAPAAPIQRPSKIATVIELLSREGGASSAELIETTGWLPHTTRAALTGLRKKGHAIERTRAGDTTRYRIVTVAA